MQKTQGKKITQVVSQLNRFRLKRSLLLASFFVFGLVVSSSFALAAFPGEGLTISPPITNITIKPGQTITQTIKVTNPTNKLVQIYPEAMDFKALGEGGQPSFYLSESSSGGYSLASWVRFPYDQLALTPQQVVNFQYTIIAPKNAESGGHYGAVFFVSNPPKNTKPGSQVSIGSMVGSLILATVPGNITEKASISNFSSNQKIHLNNKVIINTKIQNKGNIHIVPIGSIVIKNITGKIVDKLSFNDQAGNVLPASIREFDNTWNSHKFLFGYYSANLNLTYGSHLLTATTSFWIVPTWVVIVLLIILILVVFGLFYLNKKRKGRKKLKQTISKVMPGVKQERPEEKIDGDNKPPRIILR